MIISLRNIMDYLSGQSFNARIYLIEGRKKRTKAYKNLGTELEFPKVYLNSMALQLVMLSIVQSVEMHD